MATTFKNIVNRFNTTIKAASSINNTDDPVTFNITDATGIPAVPFYFTVEQLTDSSVFERMLATAVDGDEIVATRAQDGSSKQTFAAGDLVQIRVIAAHIDEPTAAINTLEGHIDQGVKVADGPTFANLTLSGLTASELTATDGDKKLQSLAVATYPSLTEVSYIKGLSSAIQTQLAGKAAVDQTMYIGTTAVNIDRASATLNLAGIGTLACGAITSTTVGTQLQTVKTTGTATASTLQVQAGDGTTSSRYASYKAQSLETTGIIWQFGLYGDKNFRFINSLGGQSMVFRSTDNAVIVTPTYSVTLGATRKFLGIDNTGLLAPLTLGIDNSNNISGIGTLACGAITSTGDIAFSGSLDSAAVADEVSIGGYEIGAGNRVLAISQETVVAAEVDETKFSNKLQCRINGATYYIMLTAT